MADPRPWLAHYPPGVPAEIDASALPSIVAMFEAACARHPRRPAYSSFGKILTWAELDRQSAHFAAFLANDEWAARPKPQWSASAAGSSFQPC